MSDNPRNRSDDVRHKKLRPRLLPGVTYRIETPLGTTYVTINEADEGPFELFIRTSKAGSETAAVAEALGRLCSLIMRLESSVSAVERLAEIAHQLEGIGGGNATGFGINRVRSLPDGVGQVLRSYLTKAGASPSSNVRQGDLCPACGHSTFFQGADGARECTNCGHKESSPALS